MQAFEPGSSLIVGAPRHALGELLIERVATEGRPVVVLVESRDVEVGRTLTRRFARDGTDIKLLVGDPSAIDLGVSGAEYLALGRSVREVHHLLASPRGAKREGDPARAVREILQLGYSAKTLERITFCSSVSASGKRS